LVPLFERLDNCGCQMRDADFLVFTVAGCLTLTCFALPFAERAGLPVFGGSGATAVCLYFLCGVLPAIAIRLQTKKIWLSQVMV